MLLSGVMAGIYTPELLPGVSDWESNQGSMIIVLDATKFLAVSFGQHLLPISLAGRQRAHPRSVSSGFSTSLLWLQTGADSLASPFFPMEHWVRQAKALGPIPDLQRVAEFPGGDQVWIWQNLNHCSCIGSIAALALPNHVQEHTLCTSCLIMCCFLLIFSSGSPNSVL
jgi:hypothetical protein